MKSEVKFGYSGVPSMFRGGGCEIAGITVSDGRGTVKLGFIDARGNSLKGYVNMPMNAMAMRELAGAFNAAADAIDEACDAEHAAAQEEPEPVAEPVPKPVPEPVAEPEDDSEVI